MEESRNNFFTESRKELEQYVRDRIWLLKLQAGEKAARLTAVLLSGLLIGLLAVLILFFVSIMAGYFFTDLTGSFYIGFGIVAGFYLLALVVLILSRKWVNKKIMDSLIRIFFTKTADDEKSR